MDESFLPKEELFKMQKQINQLKKKDDPKDDMGLAQLNQSVSKILDIFKEANEELKEDGHDAVLVSQKLDKIVERLEKIEVQNEKIAKGVVAVADMIEKLEIKQQKPMQGYHPRPRPAPPSQPEKKAKPLPGYPVKPDRDMKKSFLNF